MTREFKTHYEEMVSMNDTMLQIIGFPSLEKLFEEILSSSQLKNVVGQHDDMLCYTLCQLINKNLTKSTPHDNEAFRKKMLNSLYNDIFTAFMFYKSYKKIYKLSPNLVHLLMDTELKSVPTEYIQSPFKCIYISLPSEIKMCDPFGHEIAGMYFILRENDETTIYPSYNQELIDNLRKNPDYPARNIFIYIVCKDTAYNFYWNLFLLPGGDVIDTAENYLNKYWIPSEVQSEELKKNITPIEIDLMNVDKKPYEAEKNFFREIYHLAINTVLYITSIKEDFPIVRPKAKDVSNIKNKKKQRKEIKWSNLPYYKVGYDIVIDKQYQNMIDICNRDSSQRKIIASKFIVRGHWRMQAFGAKWSEHRKIWIKPFLKGQEFIDFVNHNYKVK